MPLPNPEKLKERADKLMGYCGITGDEAAATSAAIVKTRIDLASAGYDWAGVFDKMREEMEESDATEGEHNDR